MPVLAQAMQQRSFNTILSIRMRIRAMFCPVATCTGHGEKWRKVDGRIASRGANGSQEGEARQQQEGSSREQAEEIKGLFLYAPTMCCEGTNVDKSAYITQYITNSRIVVAKGLVVCWVVLFDCCRVVRTLIRCVALSIPIVLLRTTREISAIGGGKSTHVESYARGSIRGSRA